MSRLSIEPENDPSMQQAGIDMLLRSQGLEQPLAQMAVEVPSQRVDETTTLLRVQGDGATLRYLYEVMSDVDVLPMSMRAGLIQQNCTFEMLQPVLEAGTTIEHVYLRPDMSEIGTVIVTREICGQ